MSEISSNLNFCTCLTYPAIKHKTKVELGSDDSSDLAKWNTETHETFVIPKVEEKQIGKRRELLMKYFKLRACKDALEEILGDSPLPEKFSLSEYIDHFCDNDFTPFLEKTDTCIQKLMKSPLYGEDVQTYYKEQFDKGNLKVDTETRNRKRPFAKRSLFTTPPEMAFEEPINGF